MCVFSINLRVISQLGAEGTSGRLTRTFREQKILKDDHSAGLMLNHPRGHPAHGELVNPLFWFLRGVLDVAAAMYFFVISTPWFQAFKPISLSPC